MEEDKRTVDTSGISSLGGFAYQIRVFVYYLALLTKGKSLEFETLDDIAITDINNAFIDKHGESFNNILKDSSNSKAIVIQVKRTSIPAEKQKRVLLNWLLLKSKYPDVNKFILYTDESYDNKNHLFDVNSDQLYSETINSNSAKTALISKVKDAYIDNHEAFTETYEYIKSNYDFTSISNLDEEIFNAYKNKFLHAGISNELYQARLNELLNKITYDIINSIYNNTPYIINFDSFSAIINTIIEDINSQDPIIDYAAFKHTIKSNEHIDSLNGNREYKQLEHCGLPGVSIQLHLTRMLYFEHLKMRYLDISNCKTPKNICETAYENYCDTKDYLSAINEDTPIKRLHYTLDKDNSWAKCPQVKQGACIYLTKSNTQPEMLISWKEEDSEN